MDRGSAAGALLVLAACIACSTAAPTASNQTALDLHEGDTSSGCYYNFQHYGEGDRIMTNEPCLNCTCHNRMLMCYLRVCPFTKAIGQDCTVEKRADQCCPIVTCPDVPVDLLTSTSTTSPAEYGTTGVGRLDKYGCSINGKYFPEGSKVPSSPNKPCEHCYCIRNMTTCVMQECTLHVDGCTPIYHKEVCCPVRYSCDHEEDEIPLLDDMTTTVRPTPGFLLTTTTMPSVTQIPQECVHEDQIFPDGALIRTEKACEHCYCMKGDIVCVVQECGTPMENEGKNCTSLAPREGQCCPDTYICEGDNELPIDEGTTLLPPRGPGAEGSGYRRDESDDYTKSPILPQEEEEGSGEDEKTEVTHILDTATVTDIPSTETPATFYNEDEVSTVEEVQQHKPMTTESALPITEQTTSEPDKGENTVPSDSLDKSTTISPINEINTESDLHEVTEKIQEFTPSIDEHTTQATVDDIKEEFMKTDSTVTPEVHSTMLPDIESTQDTTKSIIEDITSEPIPKKDLSEPVTSTPELPEPHATEQPAAQETIAPFVEMEPKSTTLLLPEYTPSAGTVVPLDAVTTEIAQEVTTVGEESKEKELSTTERPEYDSHITTSRVDIPETTSINPIDNEIQEEVSPIPSPGIIPGEGNCLVNGVTYNNDSVVPSTNKCETNCKCMSSIVKCDKMMCSSPPEDMLNCQPFYDTTETCCPTYICEHNEEAIPPQSHSQMSGTEIPITQKVDCQGDLCTKPEEPSQTSVQPECSSEDCLDETKKPIPSGCDSSNCHPDQQTSDVPVHIDATEQSSTCSGENCKLPQLPSEHEIPCDTASGCETHQQPSCEGASCDSQQIPSKEAPIPCENNENCIILPEPSSSEPCLGEACTEIKQDCGSEGCSQVPIQKPSDEIQPRPEPCTDESDCVPPKESATSHPECSDESCVKKEADDLQNKFSSECQDASCLSTETISPSTESIPENTEVTQIVTADLLDHTTLPESVQSESPTEKGELVTSTGSSPTSMIYAEENPVMDMQTTKSIDEDSETSVTEQPSKIDATSTDGLKYDTTKEHTVDTTTISSLQELSSKLPEDSQQEVTTEVELNFKETTVVPDKSINAFTEPSVIPTESQDIYTTLSSEYPTTESQLASSNEESTISQDTKLLFTESSEQPEMTSTKIDLETTKETESQELNTQNTVGSVTDSLQTTVETLPVVTSAQVPYETTEGVTRAELPVTEKVRTEDQASDSEVPKYTSDKPIITTIQPTDFSISEESTDHSVRESDVITEEPNKATSSEETTASHSLPTEIPYSATEMRDSNTEEVPKQEVTTRSDVFPDVFEKQTSKYEDITTEAVENLVTEFHETFTKETEVPISDEQIKQSAATELPEVMPQEQASEAPEHDITGISTTKNVVDDELYTLTPSTINGSENIPVTESLQTDITEKQTGTHTVTEPVELGTERTHKPSEQESSTLPDLEQHVTLASVTSNTERQDVQTTTILAATTPNYNEISTDVPAESSIPDHPVSEIGLMTTVSSVKEQDLSTAVPEYVTEQEDKATATPDITLKETAVPVSVENETTAPDIQQSEVEIPVVVTEAQKELTDHEAVTIPPETTITHLPETVPEIPGSDNIVTVGVETVTLPEKTDISKEIETTESPIIEDVATAGTEPSIPQVQVDFTTTETYATKQPEITEHSSKVPVELAKTPTTTELQIKSTEVTESPILRDQDIPTTIPENQGTPLPDFQTEGPESYVTEMKEHEIQTEKDITEIPQIDTQTEITTSHKPDVEQLDIITEAPQSHVSEIDDNISVTTEASLTEDQTQGTLSETYDIHTTQRPDLRVPTEAMDIYDTDKHGVTHTETPDSNVTEEQEPEIQTDIPEHNLPETYDHDIITLAPEGEVTEIPTSQTIIPEEHVTEVLDQKVQTEEPEIHVTEAREPNIQTETPLIQVPEKHSESPESLITTEKQDTILTGATDSLDTEEQRKTTELPEYLEQSSTESIVTESHELGTKEPETIYKDQTETPEILSESTIKPESVPESTKLETESTITIDLDTKSVQTESPELYKDEDLLTTRVPVPNEFTSPNQEDDTHITESDKEILLPESQTVQPEPVTQTHVDLFTKEYAQTETPKEVTVRPETETTAFETGSEIPQHLTTPISTSKSNEIITKEHETAVSEEQHPVTSEHLTTESLEMMVTEKQGLPIQPDIETSDHDLAISSEQPTTSEPKHEYSETTPYLVELEEHTHKLEDYTTTEIPDSISTSGTMSPSDVFQTTDEITTVRQHPDVTTTEESLVSTASQESIPTEANDLDSKFGVPVESEPSKDIQDEKPPTYTTEKPEESVQQSTDASMKDSDTTTQPEAYTTSETEKNVTSPNTDTPLESSTLQQTVIVEEVTTQASLDKMTKPEPSTTLGSTLASETPKPTTQASEDLPMPDDELPPSGSTGYGQEPDYVEEDQAFGPGTCRYGGKVYVSAQQIPRDDPCDFCFCFRSDIICLQQSCPPPIHGCHEEPIQGFCCPRYECPVSMATSLNVTTTTTTTTTTLPPHFLPHAYKGAAQRKGCQIKGQTYKVGDVVRASSGPCLHCTCGGDGQMKCDPKACTPEPMLRQMIAAAVSAKRRR